MFAEPAIHALALRQRFYREEGLHVLETKVPTDCPAPEVNAPLNIAGSLLTCSRPLQGIEAVRNPSGKRW